MAILTNLECMSAAVAAGAGPRLVGGPAVAGDARGLWPPRRASSVDTVAAVMSDELGTDDVHSAPKSPPKQQRVPMSILRSGERLPSNAAPEVADSLDDY